MEGALGWRWKVPSADEAGRIRRYLNSARGRPLNRFAVQIKRLEGELTPAAISDRCRKLARTWERRLPAGKVNDGLDGLRDQLLAEATVEQHGTLLGVFDGCREGDGEQARNAAHVAHAWSGMYDRRTAQLKVKP